MVTGWQTLEPQRAHGPRDANACRLQRPREGVLAMKDTSHSRNIIDLPLRSGAADSNLGVVEERNPLHGGFYFRSLNRAGARNPVAPSARVRHGDDARGGTESAAAVRARRKRAAGGRRPEEGGSPRGMRGAKRGAAALGARQGVGGPLRPGSVHGAAYQAGGSKQPVTKPGGAKRGRSGHFRTGSEG